MIIEVAGVGTRNKGAELMLIAIQQHFQSINADVALAVNPGFGTYAQRAGYGLRHIVRPPRFGRSALAVALMPKSFKQTYGLVGEADIDAVLDASGFAFGDQHPARRTEQFADDVRRWKQQGKKIVLLPQAFGPFESLRHRQAFERVLAHVDLVFARDPVSYECIRQLAITDSQVRLAPDFTNHVKGICPPDFLPADGLACIVPNYRMIDKSAAIRREQYVPFLAACVNELIRQNLKPFLLLHDAHSDEQLVEPLQDELKSPLPVVRENDPVALKGILANVDLGVGSRFHALVGGLSQAVPCMATGWSHKYEMLFEDYGCPECVLPTDATPDRIRGLIERLSNEPGRSTFIAQLKEAGEWQVREVHQMWSEVEDLLAVSINEIRKVDASLIADRSPR